MRILAIETVTKIGSLAVIENGKILGQTTIDTHLNHASRLISSLDNLLDSCRLNLKDIGAIAVDTGPGSFTGIRVGISSAIGLAQPDDKALIAVSSLEVLAYQIAETVKEKIVMPLIDAKRGAVYSAVYKYSGGRISEIKKPYAVKTENLAQDISGSIFVFGPDIRRFSDIIPKLRGIIVDTHNTYPSAGIAARLAEIKLKEGRIKKSLEPMYIHEIEYK